MFGNHTTRRIAQWIARFCSTQARLDRSDGRTCHAKARSLRVENLEQRALLSVSGIGSEAFKSIPFTATGKTTSSFVESGYHITVNGNTTFSAGRITYDSLTHGVIAENGAKLTDKGTFTVTGKGTGLYTSWGYAHEITDNNGALTGSVEITKTTTTPATALTFKGVYDLSTATFNTRNFALIMNLTNEDGSTLKFNGKLNPVGAAFDVIVTPTWNADGTVHVGVRVPGKPHTTATPDRTLPVTNVQMYWAKGNSIAYKMGTALPDKIPVYWNELSGQYDVSELPSAPAGATHLLFVTKVDYNTRVAALPLPAVSVAAATVAEGNGEEGVAKNVADFKVKLGRVSAHDVTVRYTTVAGAGTGAGAARPGVDFDATAGTLVIPAGQQEGHVYVPVIGNTKFEPNKNFSLKLTQAQNALVSPKLGQAIGTIANDDSRPTISITDVTATEGNSGTKLFNFTVTLSNATYQTVQVKYQTSPGTAKAGVDFVSKYLTTLSFAPGVRTRTISVTVKGDTIVEPDETFFVNLSAPIYATIADGQGVGTITTDEAPAQTSALAHNAAITQFSGRAELASSLQPLGSKKSNEDATDTILAAA